MHDVAPGANIAFHTAFNSELDFAEGIIDLQEAGADVIVDDVIYFAEPMFMDGMVAQAADIVTQRGVPYFSSAGNQARDSYQNAFRGVNRATNPNAQYAPLSRLRPGPGSEDPAADRAVPQQRVQRRRVSPSSGISRIGRRRPTHGVKAGASVGEAAARSRGATSDLDLVFFNADGQPIRPCPATFPAVITCQITGDDNIGRDAVDLAEIVLCRSPDRPHRPVRRSRGLGWRRSQRREIQLVRIRGGLRATRISIPTVARLSGTRMRPVPFRSARLRGTRRCRSARVAMCLRMTRCVRGST